MTLQYAIDGKAVSERIFLDRSRCHFGGSRAWFRCPRCYGRVAVLFLRGQRFACRHCQRVAYASQSEDACARSWRKQSRIEARLGEHWQRPKGMHRCTHERLIGQLTECEERRDVALYERLGALIRRYPGLSDDPLPVGSV